MEVPPSDRRVEDEYAKSRSSKFRFKSESEPKSKRSSRLDSHEDDDRRRSKRHRSDRDHSSHHPSRRRHIRSKRSRSKKSPATLHGYSFTEQNGDYADPAHRHRESLYDALDPDTSSGDYLDPGIAFRESLFDALADDEGAAYWEGVYGQPIHNYPNTKTGPGGELEQMDEDEYIDYVRKKMWEKSHAHILEEREERERARKAQKKAKHEMQEEAVRLDAEREAFQHRVEASLKRGEERKKAKEVEAAWAKYLQKWDELKSNSILSQQAEARVRQLIPWPVVSGKCKHVTKEEIEYFLQNSSAWRDDAAALLKVERVRWHPDKMQQRFGQHIDIESMQSVTVVFQVIDKLWNEWKGRA
ncbi:uncharacterized protein BDR25DRAFT_299334 [Lindgomyces ingoldianus]|uniref:Uncharacterized protein n=1 Tax=Lindgomyces ingoldianus TaxID=673940 RepID=A0ACB6RE06_9PLEO|nr:uncharacterized protein BDR25DRAFT_299334 [Lindgomyces ingoldianus]KAF2477347.1 hypothetical protein BDR25DRAFT_299334 [Lindgomyces ingoldianus]